MLNEEPFMVLTKTLCLKILVVVHFWICFMHIKDVLIQFEVNNHVEECLLVALFKRKNIN